jgi:nucleoside permease NupC
MLPWCKTPTLLFQVPAEHVISASFMSAPAALAVSKIAFPETKIPRQNIGNEMELEIGYIYFVDSSHFYESSN